LEPDSILNALPQSGSFLHGTVNPRFAAGLIILILLIVFSALISGSEVAFFSLSPSKKEEIKNSDKRSHQFIRGLLKTPDKLLATILVANNFINVGVVILSTFLIHSLVNFSGFPLLGFFLEVILITFILLMFGEIIPKIYAGDDSLGFASFMAFPIFLVSKLFKPIVFFLTSSTSFFNKTQNRLKPNISINELNHALELTNEDELSEDKNILKGIVKFGSTNVDQVMTPRIDVVAVEIDTPTHKLLQIINRDGYSRIPVYTESFDHINGVLYIKDLLPHFHQLDDFRWQALIRPPYFVPENKKIDDLLIEFQKNKVHIAIVVDEYGGTSGIITLEDIMEEIVGEITDELDDNDDLMYTRVNDHTFLFDGKIPLIDFCRICDLNQDLFKSARGDADSLAGLLLEIKGEFPKSNEIITFEGLTFQIEALDKRMIKKIKVILTSIPDYK